MKKLKIHCIELKNNKLDHTSFEELRNMVGWIEPPQGKGNWTVTMSDGCFFDCKTQESATILASIEEVKAILINKK